MRARLGADPARRRPVTFLYVVLVTVLALLYVALIAAIRRAIR
jgi:hypothetical protein